MIETLNKWFENTDPSIVALILMTLMIVMVVWSWHRDKSTDFDLRQVLVDSVTGKMAVEKVGYMVALAISTWGFVTLILRNGMSEWYFTAYIGAFVLARFGAQSLAVWKDSKKKDDPSAPPQ